MSYFGCKFVKFFVELPTFDSKICLFSLKITPFYYPKTKFKHTLNVNYWLGDIDTRYVVLYFWFQGCIHCKHVGSVIEKFYKLNKRQDIAYLGVDTISKNKKSLLKSIESNQYDFPNYRYNEGLKDLTVNGAPMVIIYDNVQNKVLEQLLGGNPDYETKFSKLIDNLPFY